MPPQTREDVRAAFPAVDDIEDDDLRDGVLDAWEATLADNDVTDLDELPWFPPEEKRLGVDESAVEHVRDVTRCALGLADALAGHFDIDLDVVIAGALVHDLSKIYEFDGDEPTPVFELLGHPYYGVHVVARAGLPVELAHVVLSHSRHTNVEPRTVEAVILRAADDAAGTGIRVAAE